MHPSGIAQWNEATAGDGAGAAEIGADQVPLHDVARRTRAVDRDAESKFPEMILPAPDTSPPMVLSGASSIITPPAEKDPLPRLFVAMASMPMRLPSTWLLEASVPEMRTPEPLLPEMTLPAPPGVDVVPPIVLLGESSSTPLRAIRLGVLTSGIRADEVALDQVAGRPVSEMSTPSPSCPR